MAQFIGEANLKQLAVQVVPEIAMKAFYDHKAVFDKFYIKVTSGIAFKNIRRVLLTKGHTTRRKVVGQTLRNEGGKMIDRELITYLAWNRYLDNQDNYREDPILNEVDGTMSFPGSTEQIKAALGIYGEDIFDCLWHGNHALDSDQDRSFLGLYDGFMTDLANDIADTKVDVHVVTLSGVISHPVSKNDTQAWDLFRELYNALDPHLQTKQKIVFAMNTITAVAIATAYKYSNDCKEGAIVLANGNYAFPEYPNAEIAHDVTFGIGSKILVYVPENLEYGVDTENAQNEIMVQFGSDNDAKDIFLQVQSAQGTRIINPTRGYFACTADSLQPVLISGDYGTRQRGNVTVMSNSETMGVVKVDGAAPENPTEYNYGTTLVLKAEPKEGYKFVSWSHNDEAPAQTTVVTKGMSETFVATFEAE